MGIIITVFLYWLAFVAICWAIAGFIWLIFKIGEFEEWVNAKINKAFRLK